jgi:hypothetical protein
MAAVMIVVIMFLAGLAVAAWFVARAHPAAYHGPGRSGVGDTLIRNPLLFRTRADISMLKSALSQEFSRSRPAVRGAELYLSRLGTDTDGQVLAVVCHGSRRATAMTAHIRLEGVGDCVLGSVDITRWAGAEDRGAAPVAAMTAVRRRVRELVCRHDPAAEFADTIGEKSDPGSRLPASPPAPKR